MLGDGDFGYPALFGLLVVVLVAVDEDHNVGVLFQRSGLTEVPEPGPLILTRLEISVELADRDDRHLQLSCQVFQRTRDLGDLLLAVLPRRAVHELHVVDDDESETMLAFEPPALGTYVGDSRHR